MAIALVCIAAAVFCAVKNYQTVATVPAFCICAGVAMGYINQRNLQGIIQAVQGAIGGNSAGHKCDGGRDGDADTEN